MEQKEPQHTPFLEKVIGAVGALFLLAIVGFLIYEVLQPSSPPVVLVAIESITPVTGGYLVQIEAENRGETTASTVEVEGTLTPSDQQDAAPIETSMTTFDYIPSQSSRRGGLFFQADPNQFLLEVVAKGYIEP